MKFGLYLGRMIQLVDLETGEIVVWGVKPINDYLQAFEGNYTIQLI